MTDNETKLGNATKDQADTSKVQFDEKKERRKSLVRVAVTYAAAVFLFIGGGVLIALFIWTGDRTSAVSLFNTILPVAAAIIAYWFAGRSNNPK